MWYTNWLKVKLTNIVISVIHTMLLFIYAHADRPFLSLGTTVGVSRVLLSFPDGRHSDSISINVPGGFPFSDTNQTSVYVR